MDKKINYVKVKKRQNFGQGLVEYIAITALVAIVCIGGVKTLGSKVRTRINQISRSFDRNIQQGLKRPKNEVPSDEEIPDSEEPTSFVPRNDGSQNLISNFIERSFRS